jgi:hypothetical protein
MIQWIPVTDRLPADLQIVLIHTNRTNVFGYGDKPKNLHVAQFVRGKVPKKGDAIRWCDQHGNNERPYAWSGDGPCEYYGQEVTHWAELKPPDAAQTDSCQHRYVQARATTAAGGELVCAACGQVLSELVPDGRGGLRGTVTGPLGAFPDLKWPPTE